MTFTNHDHAVMSNFWSKGADWFPVREVKRGWIIETEGVWAPLGTISTVFKTKHKAIEFVDNLCMIRFKEWRAVEVAHV